MIKRIFYITIILVSFNSFGQDIDELRKKISNSSQKELTSFIKQAKDQGLSLKDAEKQLILVGGQESELKKLRELWNNKPKDLEDLEIDDEIKSEFGKIEIFNKDSVDNNIEDEIKRFGSDFFNNKNIIEVPQLFVATPNDYRLGPGDNLIINLFGAS